MKKTLLLLSLGMSILLFSACKLKKTAATSTNEAAESLEDIPVGKPEPPWHFGRIKDMSFLDGCGTFIISEDSIAYHPLNLDEFGTEWLDGTRVKFAFVPLEDIMSICMAGEQHIELLQLVKVPPLDEDCEDFLDPYLHPHIGPLVGDRRPYRIDKYTYNGEPVYYMQAGIRNFLYDCRGLLICEVPGRMYNDCSKLIGTLGEGETIWVQNE